MNILITGGNGFIARNVYESLKDKHNVYSTNRSTLDVLDKDQVDKFFDEMKGNYSKGQNVKFHPPRYLVTTLQSWRIDPTVKITSGMYSVALSRSWYNYKNGKKTLKRDMVIRNHDKMMEI